MIKSAYKYNKDDLQLEDDWSWQNFLEEPYTELFDIFLDWRRRRGNTNLVGMRKDFAEFYLTYKKYSIEQVKTLMNL